MKNQTTKAKIGASYWELWYDNGKAEWIEWVVSSIQYRKVKVFGHQIPVAVVIRRVYFISKVKDITWVKKSNKHGDWGWAKNIPELYKRKVTVREDLNCELPSGIYTTKLQAAKYLLSWIKFDLKECDLNQEEIDENNKNLPCVKRLITKLSVACGHKGKEVNRNRVGINLKTVVSEDGSEVEVKGKGRASFESLEPLKETQAANRKIQDDLQIECIKSLEEENSQLKIDRVNLEAAVHLILEDAFRNEIEFSETGEGNLLETLKEKYIENAETMLNSDQDRPPCNGWAPGNYYNRCSYCDSVFIGAKGALACSACAWGDND